MQQIIRRVVALAGVALILTLAACGVGDPLAYSKSQLALQQAQRAAQQADAHQQAMEPFDRAVAASWRIALAALPLVALGVAVDAYRQRNVVVRSKPHVIKAGR